MAWELDVIPRAGGAALVTTAPIEALSVNWQLGGPGSFECELGESNAAQWLPGQRRIHIRDGATRRWAGWLTELSESTQSFDDLSRSAGTQLRAAGLGLAWILGRRIIHGDINKSAVVATTIAWNLIQEAQAQADGDYGFTLGTVTGTAPSRTRHYCDGDNIGEAIDELAAKDPGGFDWDISELGAFRAWVGSRGVASGETLQRSEAMNWDVTESMVDLLTYATALGDAEEPCGAPLAIRSKSLKSTHGRLEEALDNDTNNVITELQEHADEELRARVAGRRRLRATWPEGKAPWSWGTVWLGDTLSVTLPTHFGGVQTLRCISVQVNVEPPTEAFHTYEFEQVGA